MNGDIRLVNGSGRFNGRLEVCLNGMWGTVCNQQFGAQDAVVVCRSLGYSRFRESFIPVLNTIANIPYFLSRCLLLETSHIPTWNWTHPH